MSVHDELKSIAVEHSFRVRTRTCDKCGRQAVESASADLVRNERGQMYHCDAAIQVASATLPKPAPLVGWATAYVRERGDGSTEFDFATEAADYCPDCTGSLARKPSP